MTDSPAAAPLNYTNRDFSSIRADMYRRLRAAIPDWVQNDSSFEVIMLDRVAEVGDVLNFYIDRMMGESYIQTAVMRESVLNLASMFGYVPGAQTSARGTVTFTKTADLGDVVVPAGTQVYAASANDQQVVFETINDHIISGDTEDIAVIEGRTVTLEALGRSTGGEGQVLALSNGRVIADSVRFFVQDGPVDGSGAPTMVEWVQIPRMIDADAPDRVFVVTVDEFGVSYVRLGDGVSGAVPAVSAQMFATYRFGNGADGNVGAGSVTSLVSGGTLSAQISSLSNSLPMTGGADPESLDSLRTNVPKSLRTLDRAVTLDDYATVALQVPGIAKASAAGTYHTSIIVYVQAIGGNNASTQLKETVDDYLTKRAMIGADVTISDPTMVPINVNVDVQVAATYRRDEVSKAVVDAITALYHFDNTTFGQTLKSSDVFAVATKIPGVELVKIDTHDRNAGMTNVANIVLTKSEIAQAGSIVVDATGGLTPL